MLPGGVAKNDKPDDPLGNGVNFVAKIIHNIGIDPNEKDIEKFKRNLIWESICTCNRGLILIKWKTKRKKKL